jgi:hypothetical protein
LRWVARRYQLPSEWKIRWWRRSEDRSAENFRRVLSGDVGEFPDIAQSDRRSGRRMTNPNFDDQLPRACIVCPSFLLFFIDYYY